MRLGPRTLTAPLLATALLAAGCSSGGGSSADGGSSSSSASSSPTSSPSSSPSSGPLSSPSASPSDDGGSPAKPGTAGLPGGVAGRSVLEGKWLNPQGRLYFGEVEPEASTQQAICAYLFGTPAQVGRTAKLRGTVTLAPRSGYASLGGNGVGFQCGYAVKGTTTFSLVVWSKKLDGSTGQATHLVETAVGRGGWGYSAYAPAYTGAAMSDATAKRWLRLAATRVTGA